jgi:hypothetical protein
MLKRRTLFEHALRSHHKDKMRELGCDRKTIPHSPNNSSPDYTGLEVKVESDHLARVGAPKKVVVPMVRMINCGSCGKELEYKFLREDHGRLVCSKC